MADLNEIVDTLSGLTVMEAAELAKLLEEKWGVSAAAPVAVAAAAGPAAAGGEAAEAKTEFDVILTSFGDKGKHGGAILLVSHDRALLESTCTQLIVFDAHGSLEIFQGRYSEHLAQKEAKAREREQDKARQKKKTPSKTTARKEDQKRKNRKKNPLERLSLKDLEKKIEQFEGRLREIDEALGEPDIWKDHQACERLQNERVKIREDLEPIEFEWSRRAEDD